ncbi:isoprenoid biosynthesis glyoxalase ElbB [bacterium]|nr:isoprenoid biosynthesis glyoxalase ElbB [bacterium]
MLKIGVILSGCGVMDGSEIHESVLTILAIDRAGAEAVCFAPDKNQKHVINHLTQAESRESRNVLAESARIARGKIQDLRKATADGLDAAILPGGYGAAKNLCDFAFKGPDCELDPDVRQILSDLNAAGKPIGAICISPAVVARALGSKHPKLTIGTDPGTAGALEKMGAKHQAARVDEIVVDEDLRIVSTPAYMLAGRISEAAAGIEKLVAEVVRLARVAGPKKTPARV